MIPGVVAMHVEMLDAVYKESKRLPPIQKVGIVGYTFDFIIIILFDKHAHRPRNICSH